MSVFPRGYIPGDRLVECDVCGLTKRFTAVRRAGPREDQSGFIVCPNCGDDGRHPREDRPKNRAEGRLQRIRR